MKIKFRKEVILTALAYSLPLLGLNIQRRRSQKALDELTTFVVNDMTMLAESQNKLIDAYNVHDDAIVKVYRMAEGNQIILKNLNQKKKKKV